MKSPISGAPPRPPLSSWQGQWKNFAPAADGTVSGGADEMERILIVEDDVLIASEMEAALAEDGFEIIGIASTGKEAFQLVEAQSPMLVVMDIRLAGDRDGIDTALELFRLHGVRCIFASAHSDDDTRRRAAPAAPLGWLQKPYTMASLTAMVRAALKELRHRPD
jgi:DNA-binding NarL/FixJ family response regulator